MVRVMVRGAVEFAERGESAELIFQLSDWSVMVCISRATHRSASQAYVNIRADPWFLNQPHTTSFTYLLQICPTFSIFI